MEKENQQQQQQQPETWEQIRPRFVKAVAFGLLVVICIWCGFTIEAQKEPVVTPVVTENTDSTGREYIEIDLPVEGIFLPEGYRYYQTALSVVSDTSPYKFGDGVLVLPDGYAIIKGNTILEAWCTTQGQCITQIPVLQDGEELVYHIFGVGKKNDLGWTKIPPDLFGEPQLAAPIFLFYIFLLYS